jgi:hypothetical protein
MGNLEDIIERNQRAPRARSLLGMLAELAKNEVLIVFDRRQPAHVRKRKALAMGVTLLVVAALIGWLVVARHDHKRARRDTVTDANGAPASLAGLWRDRPALLVFYPTFASDACEAQLQDARALGREHQLAVAAVVLDPYGLGPLSVALGPDFPIYVGSNKLIPAWGIPWQVSDLTGPAMFLVARGGEITYHRTCKDFVHCSIRTELAAGFAKP